MELRVIEAKMRVALAEVDPIGTDLGLEDRLDEYSIEASQIAKQLADGKKIEETIASVFRETCDLKLSRTQEQAIVAEFEAS